MERFEKELKDKFLKREILPSEKTWEKLNSVLKEPTKSKKYFFTKQIWVGVASFFLLGGLLMSWFRNVVTEHVLVPEQVKKNDYIQPNALHKQKNNVLEEKNSFVKGTNKKNDSGSKVVIENKATSEEVIVFKEEKVTVQKSIPDFLNSELVNEKKENVVESQIKVDPYKLLNTIEYERQIEYLAENSKSMQQIFRELKVKMVNINIEKKHTDATK